MTGLQQNPSSRFFGAYGCTVEQWRYLRDLGRKLIAEGRATPETTPLRAFVHQRDAARNRRKIDWRLSLWEWWTIWDRSGRWAERGLGRGYMMCRFGDVGPYSADNVFIGPGAENLSAATKVLDLPIGVSINRNSRLNPFRAYCNVGGKQRHLGSFPTVASARAAYDAALATDTALKMRAQPAKAEAA